MKIETKKNYTISKPITGQIITGTKIIMNNYYCEDDKGQNSIIAVRLYPERDNDNQYFLEYYGNPAKWVIDWFIKYLKTEKLELVI